MLHLEAELRAAKLLSSAQAGLSESHNLYRPAAAELEGLLDTELAKNLRLEEQLVAARGLQVGGAVVVCPSGRLGQSDVLPFPSHLLTSAPLCRGSTNHTSMIASTYARPM